MSAKLADELAGVADYIDLSLDNECADRQIVAEVAAQRIRDIIRRLCSQPEPDSLAGLGERAILRQALADAIAYRDPSGICPDCDVHPAGLCSDHAADLDKTDAYIALGRQLGIDVDHD
jgi:hypothetical protein